MQFHILNHFGFSSQALVVKPFGTGLINHTWKVSDGANHYILQRINDNVFKYPERITNNIGLIAAYLKKHHPDYLFVSPLQTNDGKEMVYVKAEGYFRMFPFVAGSHSVDVVEAPAQAYEAARQFGRFTKLLSGIPMQQLQSPLPDFHNLTLRYEQFLTSLESGNEERIRETQALTEELLGHKAIVAEYENIISNPDFKQRVTHHDTKISNVLFDEAGNGLCVIDLDTVMPGNFISDVGDMMRTYLSPVSEEEKDYSKIEIREAFYKAIVNGYFTEMQDVLTQTEKRYFFYAGTFMIYMQAIRFLTDYLNDDIYYGSKYPGHNLVRAGNQAMLLKRLIEKKELLSNLMNA